MQDKIIFDGVTYVSARRAAEEVGLSRDYFARLCKRGSVVARRVGSGWYADMRSVRAFMLAQQHGREYRRKSLIREREHEYRAKNDEKAKSKNRITAESLAILHVSDPLGEIPAKVAEPTSAPAQPGVQDVYERMHRALERTDRVGTVAMSDVSRTPSGITHAAMGLPTQILAHIPIHTISPTMELLHKVTALIGAFVIVFGTYSLFNPSYARFAYNSIGDMSSFALASGGRVNQSFVSGANAATASFAEATDHPSLMLARLRDSLGDTHASVVAFASEARSLMPDLPALLTETGSVSVALSPHSAPETPSVVSSEPQSVVSNALVEHAQAQLAAAASASPPGATSQAAVGPSQLLGSIATAVRITDPQVAYGDAVAYDPTTRTYSLTHTSDDPNAYGVIVRDPALLFASASGGRDVPVVHTGSALVNVTLENGPITAGDPLTSSSIPGKMRRANGGEAVIGTAAESFSGAGGVSLNLPNGSTVLAGTIPATITGGNAQAGGASSPAQCSTFVCRLISGIDPALVRAFIRNLLAGLIAVLSLTLAFRSFMSDANYGVISMGRNPRAKTSIQSLVLLNALLALAIASAGLFTAMIVLFAAG